LIANEIAGPIKAERFAKLAREAVVMVAIDNEMNIADLSAASAKYNVRLSVLVDVDTGLGRCGIPPGQPALDLARIACARGFRFRGLSGYEGHCLRLKPGPEKMNAVHQAMNKLVSTRRPTSIAWAPS
jgi:3-hydroxy-D-aspartate aldolase